MREKSAGTDAQCRNGARCDNTPGEEEEEEEARCNDGSDDSTMLEDQVHPGAWEAQTRSGLSALRSGRCYPDSVSNSKPARKKHRKAAEGQEKRRTSALLTLSLELSPSRSRRERMKF